MSTGEPASDICPPPPFQFTLRQLLLVMVACSIGLALIFQWGYLGFLLGFAIACTALMAFGAYRRRLDAFLIGFAMFAFGVCTFPFLCVGPRDSSRRASCQNNLRNIALALIQYESNNGCFPPPYIVDAEGKPMHSWRVLLLPYLDQRYLHIAYRFDEPWDGPNNRKLHDTVLKIYSCPSRDEKQPQTETSYVVIVGPQTMWPGDKAISAADLKDGMSNTITVVEVANSGIHWMEPRDLHVVQMPMAINPPRGQGICSAHPHGAQVSFADGSVRFLTDKTPSDVLRALLTIAGNETIGDY
jgi:prepilin-type processing-associated H-X9-DG protein